MSEAVACETQRSIDAGDVYTLDVAHGAFVLLVMSKDEVVLDKTHGAKVYVRWLAHPDPAKLTVCEWMYESSLNAISAGKRAFALIASAS